MILTEPKHNFSGGDSLLKYRIGEHLRIKINGKWFRWTVVEQIKPGVFRAESSHNDAGSTLA